LPSVPALRIVRSMISASPTVDAFLKTVSPEEKVVFVKVRALFRASGEVVESMDYRMPTYKIGAAMIGAFNKQKQYLCVYIAPQAIDPHRTELDCGKSCLRFKQPAQMPLDLLKQMIPAAIELSKNA
jgi:uncharacterized protein YdhG (YjbR/CyaY superfamily)